VIIGNEIAMKDKRIAARERQRYGINGQLLEMSGLNQ